MRLAKVEVCASGPHTFRCVGCGRRVNQARENVYADLDGLPFTDYYCPLCAGDQRAALNQPLTGDLP